MLEVCAFNVQSCFTAQISGAGRIELCADPLQGGTTPSYGTIAYALQQLSIPVYVMIRPRGGNFIYDDAEFEIMKNDVALCRQLGCPGIATGILTNENEIDTVRMKELIMLAGPMNVTCHKAFDATPDAAKSLERLVETGCSRVLTSGLRKTASEGSAVLSALVKQAAGRIIIMPGGSVRADNIGMLMKATGAKEYHSSCLRDRSVNFMANPEEARSLATQINNSAIENTI